MFTMHMDEIRFDIMSLVTYIRESIGGVRDLERKVLRIRHSIELEREQGDTTNLREELKDVLPTSQAFKDMRDQANYLNGEVQSLVRELNLLEADLDREDSSG